MTVSVEILTEAKSLLRLKPGGMPVAGQPAWIRVFGRCDEKENGCWEYAKHRKPPKSYGFLVVNGRDVGAHRIAWEHANGRRVPDGLHVLHKCDNPPCCNPAHLFIGTIADNNRDRHAKGRTVVPRPSPVSSHFKPKTHCHLGHPLSGDNLYRNSRRGTKKCATCARAAALRRGARAVALAHEERRVRLIQMIDEVRDANPRAADSAPTGEILEAVIEELGGSLVRKLRKADRSGS
jgi:hypothetical protein